MRGRDGNVHRGRPQRRLSADDQPSRRDDFRRERHVVRAAVQENFRHRRRGLHRRRRDLHRRVSRGAEPGRRRKTAARAGRRQQSIRLFHADLTPVRLRRSRGQGRRLRRRRRIRWTARIWPRAWKPSARPSPAPATATARNWSSPICCGSAATANTTTPVTLIRIEKFPARPRLPESRRGISAPQNNGPTPRNSPSGAAKPSAKSRRPSPRSSANPRPIRSRKNGGDFHRTSDRRT